MSKNNNYTTGNLLDYDYLSNHYKLIAIHLSKKTERENPDLKRQKLGNIIAKTEREQKTKKESQKARNRYKNLSEKESEAKEEYQRERYHINSSLNKKLKQSQRDYYDSKKIRK